MTDRDDYGERMSPPGRDEEPPATDGSRRARLRRRLGVTERQWLVIETVLLVLPYPFFVLVLLYTDVPELPFLLLTVAYSLVAIVVGFDTLVDIS